MNTKSKLLEKYLRNISQGDLNLTGAKAFFSNEPTTVRLLRGRNINRYKMIRESDEYIDENYLREQVKNNAANVYIVGQEVTGTVDKWRLHFALTEKDYSFLFGHTANKLLLKDAELNYFILGILNSKILDWYYRKTSTNNHVMGYELIQLPIPNCNGNQIINITQIVEKIVEKKKTNEDTSMLEIEVNHLIYQLYDLSPEEIAIIEGVQ